MSDATPPTAPHRRRPPTKHQLALMIWLAVFPTLTVLNLALGDLLADAAHRPADLRPRHRRRPDRHLRPDAPPAPAPGTAPHPPSPLTDAQPLGGLSTRRPYIPDHPARRVDAGAVPVPAGRAPTRRGPSMRRSQTNRQAATRRRPPSAAPVGPPSALDREPGLVGRGFIALYMLAYAGAALLFLAPLLVSLALKVNASSASTGPRAAWRSSPASAPCCPSSATRSSAGSATAPPRRGACAGPGCSSASPAARVGTLDVAIAPNIAVVLARLVRRPGVLQRAARRAWSPCCPTRCRRTSAASSPASSAICLPVASVAGTFLVQLFDQNQLTMFLAPCAVGGRLRARCSPPGSTTAGWTRPTSRRGHCASSPARSTSTRAPAPTSRGRSPAGSCW